MNIIDDSAKKLKCTELDKVYSKEIGVLQSYDCVKFVKELRRFSQHLGLPLLAGHMSIGKSEFSQKITFQKEELDKWNEWCLTSKMYMNSKKEIEPKLIFEEYQFLISNFYDWFYRTVSKIFQQQIREFLEVESELAKLSP